MAHNDFVAQGNTYDPNEIMTKARDAHGHSTNQRVHIPPSWRAIMEVYIQSDLWPEYTGIQPIVRDALYHRLHWAAEQKARGDSPMVKQAMVRERYRKRLNMDSEYENSMKEFRRNVDDVLGSMLQQEQFEAVQAYCEDILQEMDAFPGHEQEKLLKQVHTFLERAKGRW